MIGGIVDRDRLKGTTKTYTLAQGIRCARLPLNESRLLAAGLRFQCKSLNVNHVFEIIQRYFECEGDWKAALLPSVPTRKGFRAVKDNESEGKESST